MAQTSMFGNNNPVYGTGSGSNQFFNNIPSMPSKGGGNPSGFNFSGVQALNNPYQVPSSSSSFSGNTGGVPPAQAQTGPFGWPSFGGTHAVPPQYPGVAGNFANWIQSQIGQGVTPFNLSTPLPGGGQTKPGQLTASDNPILQQLMQFFQGKGSSSMPGMNTLSTIADKGISALPEWQTMIDAQQQNIQQNEANITGQFASMGNLAGSPFATAMTNFGEQTTKDQNALLAQLQQQNILQGQLPASELLTQMGTQFGQYQQGLNQQAIQNQYGEFVRTQPQYNPLIQDMMGLTSIYPPTVQSGSGMGGLGALLSGGGQGIGAILQALGDAGMLPG